VFLVAVELADLLARPDVYLALEFPLARVGPTFPDRAAGFSLDAFDSRVRDVVLLFERVRHFLDREAGALPLDAVDRAAREQGGEREEQAATTEHEESFASNYGAG
jgi:hypothetical protein